MKYALNLLFICLLIAALKLSLEERNMMGKKILKDGRPIPVDFCNRFRTVSINPT